MMPKAAAFIISLLVLVSSAQAQPRTEVPETNYVDSVLHADQELAYVAHLDSLLKELNTAQKQPEAPVVNRPKAPSGSGLLASFFNHPATKIFFWMVLLLFAGFVVRNLFKIPFTRKSGKEEEPDELPENEPLKNAGWYDNEILRAEREQDFARAIRRRYMQLLALLDERKVIVFMPGKTNAAYAAEIDDRDLRDHFRHLSMVYEYVWYGDRKLSAEHYTMLRNLFNKTIRQM